MDTHFEASLSPRERQIVGLLRHGKSNKEIASDLCLAYGTVKEYMVHIFRKTGATNRTELAILAEREYVSRVGSSTLGQ